MTRALALSALVCTVFAACDSQEETPVKASSDDAAGDATKAAEAWLKLVDEGRYGESWEGACEYFRGAVPKSQWVQQVRGVRKPLGAVKSRERVSAQPKSSLPGAPDGDYVVIQYRTRFANKKHATETITPMREPDGVYRVSGYYIK